MLSELKEGKQSIARIVVIWVLVAISLLLGYLPYHSRIKTEQLDVEQETRLIRSLAMTETAVVVIDENSIVTVWDKNAERIFGYTQKEALGAELSKLIMVPGSPLARRHDGGVRSAIEGSKINPARVRTIVCYAYGKDKVAMPLIMRLHIPYDDNEVLAFVNKIPEASIPDLIQGAEDVEAFISRGERP